MLSPASARLYFRRPLNETSENSVRQGVRRSRRASARLSRLLAIPVPRWFRLATILTQQFVDRFVHRNVTRRKFRSRSDQRLDDLGIQFRIAAVSSRPKRLAENCSAINICRFERRIQVQQQLYCLELTIDQDRKS